MKATEAKKIAAESEPKQLHLIKERIKAKAEQGIVSLILKAAEISENNITSLIDDGYNVLVSETGYSVTITW